MFMKRHIVTVLETEHKLVSSKGNISVGQLIDDMIAKHVANEEKLEVLSVTITDKEWDAMTNSNPVPDIRDRYNSDLIRSAYSDNDEDTE